MRILNSKKESFNKILNNLLQSRKKKLRSSNKTVIKIIKDIKNNGDKALIKYERKFNRNKIIKPSRKQISRSIAKLDKKVKKAIDLAYDSNDQIEEFSVEFQYSYWTVGDDSDTTAGDSGISIL